MKKTLNLIIGVIITGTLVCMGSIISYAANIKGSGTETSPYIIETEEQLLDLAEGKYSYSAHYILGNDIKLIARSWPSIAASDENGFSGTFDGKNHKISGLSIGNMTNEHERTGLFAENTGTISNLTVESSSVVGNKYTGIIAGKNKGIIENCVVTGLVRAEYSSTDDTGETSLGGISGENKGFIKNCKSSAEIKDGNTNSGGIAGYSDGTISECSFNGRADDLDTKYFGGIVGYTKGIVKNCANTGIINAYINYLGGIAGCAEDGSISCCSNKADIVSTVYDNSCIGGLIGRNDGAGVENCYSIGNISCETNTINYTTYVGGFIGYNSSDKDISYCYCVGTVIGREAMAFANGTSKAYKNCFYNRTIQNTYETVAFDLTDEQMKDDSKYRENFPLWNFNSIWGIDRNANEGYPYLLSMVIPASEITISDESITLALGESIQLSASVLPEDATNRFYTWDTSDDNIVSVDANGMVTANRLGNAVITVTSAADKRLTKQCDVTVVQNTRLNETLIFKADDISTVSGQYVTVPIRLLTGNSTGVHFLALDVSYDDDYLIPEEKYFKPGDIFSNVKFTIDSSNKVIHIKAQSSEDSIGNGIICYLEFKTVANYNDDMKSDIVLSIKELKAYTGSAEKNLKSATYEGVITIKKFLYGDLDGDRRTTVKDAALVLEKALNSDFIFPIEKKE